MFATSPVPLTTDEEFNSFHTIDRKLYSILIIHLGRDIAESMNVMAFWLWLEQQKTRGMTLVKRMLSMSYLLINNLADESVLCLKCAEKDNLSSLESEYKLILLPHLLGKNIRLQYFFENRLIVLQGVALMCSQVCCRAFRDINQNFLNAAGRRSGHAVDDKGKGSSFGTGGVDQRAGLSMQLGRVRPAGNYASQLSGFHRTVLDGQRMQQISPAVVNDELNQIFRSKLNLEVEENEVHPDDRTIFLTFSKGYPISEDEVRDFFTREFGDFIEEIHMQPVSLGQQVLYARVVARSRWASVIDAVVKGRKTKYNINGKHVCARKFVKRNI